MPGQELLWNRAPLRGWGKFHGYFQHRKVCWDGNFFPPKVQQNWRKPPNDLRKNFDGHLVLGAWEIVEIPDQPRAWCHSKTLPPFKRKGKGRSGREAWTLFRCWSEKQPWWITTLSEISCSWFWRSVCTQWVQKTLDTLISIVSKHNCSEVSYTPPLLIIEVGSKFEYWEGDPSWQTTLSETSRAAPKMIWKISILRNFGAMLVLGSVFSVSQIQLNMQQCWKDDEWLNDTSDE